MNNFEELENKRKKARLILLLAIVSFVLGSFLIYYFMINYIELILLGIVVLIAGAVLMIISMKIQSNIRKDFKQKYIVPYVKEKFPTIEYFPDKGLSETFVNSLNLYQNPDRFKSEDYFEGEIENVKFFSSDCMMEERHITYDKNGMHEYYSTFFKGRIAVFEFKKKFKDVILVTEGQTKKPRGSKKVELESIDFNKKFKTFCSDDLNAFYVLTPEIILSILALEKENPGKLVFLFEENRLTICINNNVDTFEVNLNKKIDQKFLDIINRDIGLFKDLIIKLKLNKTTFKEE